MGSSFVLRRRTCETPEANGEGLSSGRHPTNVRDHGWTEHAQCELGVCTAPCVLSAHMAPFLYTITAVIWREEGKQSVLKFAYV